MSDQVSDPDRAASNPYIALRQAKIRRNEARLAELGLLHPTIFTKKRTGSDAQRRLEKRPVTPKPVQEATRRSRRISQQSGQPNYKEVNFSSEKTPKRLRVLVDDANNVAKDDASSFPPTEPMVTKHIAPAANSVRSINIDCAKLIIGENGLLWKMMEHPGKEHVINKCFDLAASYEDRQRLSGTRLSFNKYCGVQEWHNAVFLWINLGSKDNVVVNEFLNGGKQITWFGGSRMYDHSPVIHKLLRLGKEATKSTSRIVLWVRKYDAKSKKFTPYICLGRLSYHSHQPGSHPLAFVWDLIDASFLKINSEASTREQYENLFQT